MSPQLRNAIEQGGSKRSAMSDEKYKWPDAVVPYEFHTSLRKLILPFIGVLYLKLHMLYIAFDLSFVSIYRVVLNSLSSK